MTDEMQIQQQRPSALPYVGVGALAGAGAGYAADRLWITKPLSHEDIIKEANDNDKIEIRTKEGAKDADTWKNIQEKAKAVNEAKAKLDEAQKGVLPAGVGTTEQANYDKAVREQEQAWKKLYETKVGELGGSNSNGKIKPFNQLDPHLYNENNVKTGKLIKDKSSYSQLYNDLVQKLNIEENKLNQEIDSGLKTQRDTAKTEVKNFLNKDLGTYINKSDDRIALELGRKEYETKFLGIPTIKQTQSYIDALTEANKVFPDFTEAMAKNDDKYILQFATKLEDGATAPQKSTIRNIYEINPATHRLNTKPTIYYYSDDELKNFVAQQQAVVENKRLTYADEIFNARYETVVLEKQKANFKNVYSKSVNKGLAVQSGYLDSNDNLDIDKILKESRTNKLAISQGKKRGTLIGYEADIKELKKAVNNRQTNLPGTLNGAYGTTDPAIALDQANARNSIVKEYNVKLNDIEKNIKDVLDRNSRLQDFNAKIEAKRAGHQGVANARAKLLEQFPDVFGNNGSTTLTAAEIEAQAKAHADANIDKKWQEAIDTAKTKLDEVKAKHGKVDTAAEKTAKEGLESAEKALKEAAENFSKKMGKNKWVAMGVGAVALGLAGLALRPKAKDA